METKKHEPVVYQLYDYLKTNHIGKANAILGRDLSAKFNFSERKLRYYVRQIRESTELSKVVLTCNRGYYIPTREEGINDVKRQYSQAFSTLKIARLMEKKAELDGQEKLPLGKYYQDFVTAFGGQ